MWGVSSMAVILRPQRRMRRAAGRVLSDELGHHSAGLVLADADEMYPHIAGQIPETRVGAHDLLRTSAYAVALHRVLVGSGFDSTRANALIADAVYSSIIGARTFLYHLGGLRYRKPLDRARWGSRIARRFYYRSPDWVMEDVDMADGFGFDVSRCVVAEFFRALGMGDLCSQAICAQDVRTAQAHGVVLERTQTLATGGSHCDFRYRAREDPATPTDDRSRDRTAGRTRRRRTLQETTLTDSVEIDAPPGAVWAWLSAMAAHYTEWHPDHVSARWIRGEPNRVGSRLEAIEHLAGHREKLVFEMTRVDPLQRLEYRVVGPHAILLPRGRFVISGRNHASVFRAEIDVRFGRLAARVFRRRMEGLRTHMHEEGMSLKRLVEAPRPHRS